MLSLDVALQAAPAVDRVGVLSGVMLEDSLSALAAPHPSKPSVFVSHGRQDQVLSFAGAERACQMLERHGYPIEFHPFDGGHQIPNEVTSALATFIYA
jgi:phospholipase/carboxylesterase